MKRRALNQVRLLAGPFDGQTIARLTTNRFCREHDGVLYEYEPLPDDPNVWALVRWGFDTAAIDRELQEILTRA